MSKEMKKIIVNMIKYDIIFGFIFLLILSVLFNLKVGLIFFLGLIISLINTSTNGLIIEYSLAKNKKALLGLSYIFRIILIILIALPFLSDLIQIISYILGYLAHLLFIVIYWVKNGKGRD